MRRVTVVGKGRELTRSVEPAGVDVAVEPLREPAPTFVIDGSPSLQR
ncbi:MAG TPA: hypothetical protein VMX12_08585 [Acidimicrobiia bacterium]|nr:hypothetical protein [Acidimicrobiia bacterium]